MARCFVCLVALSLLCPKGAFSGIGFRMMPRDTMVDFEATLFPFEAEDWENGSIWKRYSYEDIEKELNGTAPRPPEGGGYMLAKLDIKGTSAGSFMTLPMTRAVTGVTMIFDYFLHSTLDQAAGIRIEYQKGNSGYKNLAAFFAPKPNDEQFHTAIANLTLAKPSCVTLRVYGNGDGGKKPDIVAIDNFRIRLHLGTMDERKGLPVMPNGYVLDQKSNCFNNGSK